MKPRFIYYFYIPNDRNINGHVCFFIRPNESPLQWAFVGLCEKGGDWGAKNYDRVKFYF